MIARHVTLLACAAALSACGAPSSLSSTGAIPQSRVASPAGTPIPFTFQTVDDPLSSVNQVTGINASSEVTGTIGSGAVSSPYVGYSSTPPYTIFTPIIYSSALGTFVTSLSNSPSNTIFAGFVISPPQLRGTWGFVYIKGIMSLLKDHKEGTGSNAVTELLGVNDSQFAVGFYTNALGSNVPVVLNIPAVRWTQLKPPGYKSAEATAINGVNDIVGWEKTSSGTTGFFVRAGSYYTVAYPGAKSTEALGINSSDQIVGFFTDTKDEKHGFIESNPSGQPAWQEIDDPDGANGTVVTGVNDSDNLSGYYVDGSGVQHGLVAAP